MHRALEHVVTLRLHAVKFGLMFGEHVTGGGKRARDAQTLTSAVFSLKFSRLPLMLTRGSLLTRQQLTVNVNLKCRIHKSLLKLMEK